MRSVQEVFVIVLQRGLYPRNRSQPWSTNFMCHAIECAYECSFIAEPERLNTLTAISEYMDLLRPTVTTYGHRTLTTSLKEAGIEGFSNLDIYSNWSNRPLPKVEIID